MDIYAGPVFDMVKRQFADIAYHIRLPAMTAARR